MPRLTISTPNKAPQPYRFPVDCKLISIGKSSSNDITIDSESVSGEHCLIERIKGGYIIRDNGSTNGIKQGGKSVVIGDLSNESEVFIGDIPLLFQLSEEELDAINNEDFTSQQDTGKKNSPNNQADLVAELGVTALPEAEEIGNKIAQTKLPSMPNSKASAANSTPPLALESESMGAGTAIMLGLLAIFIGMCIRHQMDTGSFLLTELLVKYTG